MVLHNGSKYDDYVIIKELAEELEGQFESLGQSTEKDETFSVPIGKELENDKTNTYKLKFIDSLRFMSSSLSSLPNNLPERLHNNRCKDCKSSLEYIKIN